MAITIFYSWQSDSSTKVNRTFIEEALKKAIKEVGKNLNLEDAPRDSQIILDKDTKGIPGQPHITEVIFQKISKCGIFVPDLTFVGKSKDGRLLMNPNVLIEYGWALNKPSRSRIVAVMNTAFGEPGEDLPFDMRHVRHPLTYNLKEDATPVERKEVLISLVKELADAIKTILESGVLTESLESKPFEMIQPTTSPSIFLEGHKAVVGVDYDAQPLILPNVQHLFLRIVPTQQGESIKSSKVALDLVNSGSLRPFYSTQGFSVSRNKYGAFTYLSENGKVLTLTQLFLNNELWGIDAYSIYKQRLIEGSGVNFGYFPCGAFEDRFLNALENYLKFANEILQLPLPLKIIAGATAVEGYRMATLDPFNRFDGYVHDKNLVWEGEVNDYNLKVSRILRPFFDYVWEECGLERPDKEFLNS